VEQEESIVSASTSPVLCRGGYAVVSTEVSPSSSSPSAWGSWGHGPVAADEMQAYGSPSASESGHVMMEGAESLSSVSGLRVEPGMVDTGNNAKAWGGCGVFGGPHRQ
jgi:hypothetical protein